MPAPSTTMQAPAECSPNTGGSNADPEYNNPTYQLFNATNNSLSPALALSILLESWPINSYPWLCVLPSGSVLIIAGIATEATCNVSLTKLLNSCIFESNVYACYQQWLLQEWYTSILLASKLHVGIICHYSPSKLLLTWPATWLQFFALHGLFCGSLQSRAMAHHDVRSSLHSASLEPLFLQRLYTSPEAIFSIQTIFGMWSDKCTLVWTLLSNDMRLSRPRDWPVKTGQSFELTVDCAQAL